jgi:hypothetical protein
MIPAAVAQASIATSTQVGIGTVPTRPCLPTRSAMHQRPSPLLDVPEGERRDLRASQSAPEEHSQDRPISQSLCWWWHPARSGALGLLPSQQFPRRKPLETTPFTHVIPFASSDANGMEAAVSTASFRTP